MPAPRRSAALALALASAALWPGVAPTRAVAGLVLAVQPSSATAGGTGSFDVTLADNGGTFQVAIFSVELSVTMPSGVKFASATVNTTTAPYIFGSLQSPPFTNDTFPNITFTASDSPQSAPGFVTLVAGQTVGLEHVTYSVAPGTAPGPIAVAIDDIGGGTSLSDLLGDLVPFTPAAGTITVAPAGVPEPSSLALSGVAAAVGLAVAAARGLRRRRRPVA